MLEHELELVATLAGNLAVAQDTGLGAQLIVTDEGRFTLAELHPITGGDGGCGACKRLLLLLQLGFEALHVHHQLLLGGK